MRTVIAIGAATLVALGACGDRADDPVRTTRAFLAAAGRGDCATAWSFFSRGTQENVAAQIRKEVRDAPYRMEPPRPEEKYCAGTYGGARPRTARLIDQAGDTAVVSVGFAEGTHVPLIPFLSTPYREWSADVRLVREDARWKIERPRVEVGRPGWDVVEVGEVEVAYSRHGDPRRRWVQARGVVRASREALAAVLSDPRTWSRLVPLLAEARVLDGGGAASPPPLLLRFAAPDGAGAEVPVHVQPSGHVRDPHLPWTQIQLVAAADATPGPAAGGRPTVFSGSWELRERQDGFWVTFGFVVQPDEWPPGLVERLLAADVVAGAVAALEREALRVAVAAGG